MQYPDFSRLRTKLTVKDHTVSNEKFELKHWPEYDMLVTHPQPSEETLASYYESEDYISHTDSKASVTDKLYQSVKTVMLKKKLKLLSTYHPEKGTLLDIGSGTGDFLNSAQDDGWIVSGYEPHEKAKSLAVKKGVSIDDNLKTLPKNNFDVITMWHVLEHIPNLFEHIELVKTLLKDSGTLIIAVPNYKSQDAKHYQKFWAAYDVPRHLWHFSATGISKLFSDFGFIKKHQHPMIFDAYYVSLLSEKYKQSLLSFLMAIFNGFWSNLKAVSTKEYSSLIYVFQKSK